MLASRLSCLNVHHMKGVTVSINSPGLKPEKLYRKPSVMALGGASGVAL